MQLAVLQEREGDLESAEASITKAIDCAESDFRARFLAQRAGVRQKRGDREAALVDAVAARTAEPESFEYWMLEARLLVACGRGDEACAALVEANQREPGNEAVAQEQAFVAELAAADPAVKRRMIVDLYKRVVDGAAGLGFPLSIHFEATYGYSAPAFDTFAEMLAYWSPR